MPDRNEPVVDPVPPTRTRDPLRRGVGRARVADRAARPLRSSSARSTGSPTSTRSTRSTRARSPASSTPATATPTPRSSPPRSPRWRGPRPASSAPRGWRPSRRSSSPASDRATRSRSPTGSTARRSPSSAASSPGSGSRTRSSTRPVPRRCAGASTPRTRLVFAETLSNPLVRLADIAGLAEVARGLGVEATLVVDHTFAPLLCRPLELGADAVTHSLTKLIGGHSDVTLGLLAGVAIADRPRGGRRLDVRPDGQPVRELARPPRRRRP